MCDIEIHGASFIISFFSCCISISCGPFRLTFSTDNSIIVFFFKFSLLQRTRNRGKIGTAKCVCVHKVVACVRYWNFVARWTWWYVSFYFFSFFFLAPILSLVHFLCLQFASLPSAISSHLLLFYVERRTLMFPLNFSCSHWPLFCSSSTFSSTSSSLQRYAHEHGRLSSACLLLPLSLSLCLAKQSD